MLRCFLVQLEDEVAIPRTQGAHHVSHAEGEKVQESTYSYYILGYRTPLKLAELDRETFEVMWEMSAPGGEAEGCFLRISQTDYFYDGRDVHLDWMPDVSPANPLTYLQREGSHVPQHKHLPTDALSDVPGAKTGISFTTVTIDTPAYCNYLLSRFLARGGSIVRATVQHIDQIAEGGPHVFTRGSAGKTHIDAIVVCTGLGARTLGGIEDKDVYPVRGQVVMLRAPWIDFGRTVSHAQEGLWTYIIPRRSGDVRDHAADDGDRATNVLLSSRSLLAERRSTTTGTQLRDRRRRQRS